MMEEIETKSLESQETDIDLFDTEGMEAEDGADLFTAEEPAPAEPRKLKIKYMGEEKELSEEEAVTYAQKGMDYDPVKKELSELKSGGAHEALAVEKQIAESCGMTVSEYRKHALEQVRAKQMESALKKVLEEYPGLPEAAAKELAGARIGAKETERKEAAEAAEAETWSAIAEAYPELKSADDIPEDVREAIDGGKDPLLAMREHELKELKEAIAQRDADAEAIKQNEQNRQKAVGAVAPGSGNEKDPFLSGLFG